MIKCNPHFPIFVTTCLCTVAWQIHIRLKDVNDNPPVFTSKNYRASVMENLLLVPPAPIVKVHAEDQDEGKNGAVRYSVLSGDETGKSNIFNYLIFVLDFKVFKFFLLL